MRAAPREYFIGGNVRNGLRHDQRNSRYDVDRRRAHVTTLSHHASRSEYCHCRNANSKTTGAHGDPSESHYSNTITVELGQHQPFAGIVRKYGIFPKPRSASGRQLIVGQTIPEPRPSRCRCTGPPDALWLTLPLGALAAMGQGQKSERAGSEARGGGGLGFPTPINWRNNYQTDPPLPAALVPYFGTFCSGTQRPSIFTRHPLPYSHLVSRPDCSNWEQFFDI
jgi:hypothetical protein